MCEYNLCGVRQTRPRQELNLSDEVISRELDSDFQKLNGIRGEDIRSDSGPNLSISGRSNEDIRKTFWFQNVRLSETNDSLHVTFSDGHTEAFENADIWAKYPTLNLDHYGDPVLGIIEHPNSGTVHIVNESTEVLCGRCQWVSENDIKPLKTESDDLSYNSFCSQCLQYDGLIYRSADLGIPVEY